MGPILAFMGCLYIMCGMITSLEFTRTLKIFDKYDQVRLFEEPLFSVLSTYFLWPYFIYKVLKIDNRI